MAASSTSLLTTPTSKLLPAKPAGCAVSSMMMTSRCRVSLYGMVVGRRDLTISIAAGILSTYGGMVAASPALAASDEEYVKETTDVIEKVRTTMGIDKADPNVASAVAELREASNSWVSKYRREKTLLGRASFRDMYSALNAVSGHYISFGPTAPIPPKRKARILEEVETAEKALLRGR